MIVWGFCGFDLKGSSSFKNEEFYWISGNNFADTNIFDLINLRVSSNLFGEALKIDKNYFHLLFSRHWYPQTKSEEFYERASFLFVGYFSELLDRIKPNKIIFSNIPHEGPDYILLMLARKKEIPVFIFYQSLLPSFSYVLYDQTFNSTHTSFISSELVLKKEINNLVDSIGNWFYMKTVRISSLYIDYFKNIRRSNFRKIFHFPRVLKDILARVIEFEDIPLAECLNKRFVYFPLHLQPELTTDVLGGEYHDQFKIIEDLCAILPMDVMIYVKENPKQSPFRREKFYRQLKTISRVRMLPRGISSLTAIKECLCVVTVSGTVGWEAINLRKKVVIFGDAWYEQCSGVARFHNDFDFEKFLKDPISECVDFRAEIYTILKDKLFMVTSDFDYSRCIDGFDTQGNMERLYIIIRNLK